MSIVPAEDRKWLSLGILLVCTAVITPFGWLLHRMIPSLETSASAYYAAVLLQEIVLWLLPALILRPWRMKRLGEKSAVMPLMLSAIPAGAMIQVFAAAVYLLFPAFEGNTILPQSAGEWALAVLALVIAPAVCEECFFRGCVTVHLQDVLPTGTALITSTLLFALMHGSTAGLPAHLLISFCCTLMMLSTGRVLAPILTHMGFNAAALCLAYCDGSLWLVTVGILPVCLCIWMLCRLHRCKTDSMTAADKILLLLCLAGMLIRYFLKIT